MARTLGETPIASADQLMIRSALSLGPNGEETTGVMVLMTQDDVPQAAMMIDPLAARSMARTLVKAAEEIERGEPAGVLPEYGVDLN